MGSWEEDSGGTSAVVDSVCDVLNVSNMCFGWSCIGVGAGSSLFSDTLDDLKVPPRPFFFLAQGAFIQSFMIQGGLGKSIHTDSSFWWLGPYFRVLVVAVAVFVTWSRT